MIKQEKLSVHKARIRVSENLNKLLNSDRSIKSIFEISFSHRNFTLFNCVKYNSLKEITYGEAYESIKLFAGYFNSVLPSNEKYVGLLLDNSPEWIYSLYALLMTGHTPVLLSTKASESSNKEILDELKSTSLISDKFLNEKYNNVINPFKIANNNKDFIENWSNEIIFITSGTSGKSKVIKYTGEELVEQIVNASGIVKNYPQIASTYNGYLKHLVILPLYHVFGFIAVFLWFSFFNTTFVLPSSLASINIKEAALIGEPTHIFAVPLFWDTVTKTIEHVVHQNKAERKFEKGINLSIKIQKVLPHKGPKIVRNKLFGLYLDNIFGKSIQFCITGGSYISENTLRVINGLGYPLVNGFGSTEIGISSFANSKKIKTRLDNSIGSPFDNFNYLVDENGELLVKGKSAFNSILINGEFTKRDKDSFVHTADYALLKKDKYYVTGRMDEIFVDANGENYSLPKIEQEFRTSFANDLVVLPLKDSQSLSVILSFNANVSEYQINYDLVNIVKSDAFIKNKIKEVYYVKHEFEKANGLKVKRNKLIELMNNRNDFVKVDINSLSLNDDQLVINDSILNVVIEKFKLISHTETVNKNSDFFLDLGGDSLSYYELINSLEGYFGVKFNFEESLNRTPLQFMVTISEKI